MKKKDLDNEILYILYTPADTDVFLREVDVGKNARVLVKFYDTSFQWHGFQATIPFADLASEEKEDALSMIVKIIRVGCDKLVQQYGIPLSCSEIDQQCTTMLAEAGWERA